MKQPTHAIYFSNNWDGEGDLMWLWSFNKNDTWFDFDTGELLIQYEGDEIISIVELNYEQAS